MATRRAVLAAGVGLTLERAAGSCSRQQKPSPSEAPPSPIPSRIPPILDLTELMAPTPRPVAATEATKSAARLWLDNTGQEKRNALSAVHVEPGLFLSVEHGRRRTVNGSETDPIELTRYRARLAITDAAGSLAVVRATRVAMERDFVTDAALFQVDDLPSGLAVARRTELSGLSVGATMHHVGYQPAPGTSRFDIPIGQPAPQAGFRSTLLTNGGSQFHVLAGIGRSEGAFAATTSAEGTSGGPVYTNDGLLVGTTLASERETVTVGDIIDSGQFGNFERVVNNGVDVPRSTAVKILTCQAASDLLLDGLKSELAPIPSPGY